MAYLSRLRNPQNDRYEHYGMSAVFGEVVAEEALRRSHQEMLMSFLGLSLLDQVDDVRNYVVVLPESAKRLLASWEKNKGYETVLPPGASLAERELFEANLGLIIRQLRGESGVVGDPDSMRSQ